MQTLFRVLAFVGLVLVIGPPLLYYGRSPGETPQNAVMLLGTALWFAGSVLGFRQNGGLAEESEPIA